MFTAINRVVLWPYLTDENNMEKAWSLSQGRKKKIFYNKILSQNSAKYVMSEFGEVFPLYIHYTPIQTSSSPRFRHKRSPTTWWPAGDTANQETEKVQLWEKSALYKNELLATFNRAVHTPYLTYLCVRCIYTFRKNGAYLVLAF